VHRDIPRIPLKEIPMKVFVTGATGFIGSAVVLELLAAGHQVTGLVRAEAKAAPLAAAGMQVHLGTIEELDSLKRAAAAADGVIHLAFNHDFSRYQANCEDDRRVIEALGSVLAGSDRPLLVTSGTGMANLGAAAGHVATELDEPASSAVIPRAASEEAAAAVAARGVNVSIVRLPQVHDTARQGLVSYAIRVAHQKGVVAHVGDGRNRWPAAHVTDTARLYRLALERRTAARYHAVAEEGVALADISRVLGERLQLPVVSLTPEEAAAHFGWLAMFAGADAPASSAQTRKVLGWQPAGPSMLTDLANLRLEG
jgi:nucleoside-diphosphate-sugar epimerase